MIRGLLAPLDLLYAAGLRARNAAFNRNPPLRLEWPVVSVGNLSIGGSGKTPLVIHLARLLARRGWSTDVLSRGYGRRSDSVERVDPSGAADRFGDEPLLIARKTGAPVFAGASRYAAGRLAELSQAQPPDPLLLPVHPAVHLLDDGFQHRQLARTVDIVILHPRDVPGRLLPSGRLREPLTALSRAGIVAAPAGAEEARRAVERYAGPGTLFWRIRRRLKLPGMPARVVAFCAIAWPRDFFQEIERAGATIVSAQAFRDHHRYRASEVTRIAQLGGKSGCEAFVTTEKDEVKLDMEMRRILERVAPIRVAELALEIEDEDEAISHLIRLLNPPGRGAAGGGAPGG